MERFEADLHHFLERAYDRRAGVAATRVQQRVLETLDHEKRRLIPLVAGVLIGVGLTPFVGTPGVVVGLVLLYVGAFASGVWTMRRAERIEAELDPRIDAQRAAEEAWRTRPPLGAEECAQLTRIMNLAVSAGSLPAIRAMLLGELREARTTRSLRGWRFLDDLTELLEADAAALA
jgi:hypothetical protein